MTFGAATTVIQPSQTNTIVATKPTGLVDGEVIVLVLGNFAGNQGNISTITWPTGFTQLEFGNSNYEFSQLAFAWKVASGEPSTWNIVADRAMTGLAYAVRLQNPGSSPQDGHTLALGPGAGSSSPVSVDATGLTTTATDTLIWVGMSAQTTDSIVSGFTVPSGFTAAAAAIDDAGSFVRLLVGYKDSAGSGATGTESGSLTLSSSTSGWIAGLIAFKELAGPVISVQPTASTQLAAGSTATLSVTASASGGGTLSYQWQVNGSNVSSGSGGTTISYTTPELAYSDDLNSYTCVVTETGGTSPGSVTSSAGVVHVGLWVIGSSTPVFSASAGTTVAPSYSTLPAIQANDIILLVVAQKPSAANGGTVTTPSGFTLQSSLTGAGGYGATLANNTGNTNLFVYSKDSVSGSETGTLTVTVGTNGVCGATFVLIRPMPGCSTSYAATTGSDSAAGNVSVAGGADPGVIAGDLAILTFNGSSALATYSAEDVTQTGITYSAVTELAEPSTTVGNDVAGFIAYAKAQSGTSSAAPTFTATTGGTNTNARGPGIFVRVRSTGLSGSAEVFATQRQANNTLRRM